MSFAANARQWTEKRIETEIDHTFPWSYFLLCVAADAHGMKQVNVRFFWLVAFA